MDAAFCAALLSGVLAAAGVVDARTRRLPHGLALALLITAALYALATRGLSGLGRSLAAALVAAGALTALELLWRRVRGAAGQGMGDIKALFALLVADPVCAAVAYVLALLALAGACLALRLPSLPLLPFLAAAFIGALVLL